MYKGGMTMNCNCAVVNFVLAAVIFVLAISGGILFDNATTLWVIIIASALLLIHSVWHASCMKCGAAPARSARRRK